MSWESPQDECPEGRGRNPAVVIALGFALGIAIDRWCSPVWAGWLTLAGVSAAFWSGAFLSGRIQLSAVCLWICCLCLGGARHHQFWSIARPSDLSTLAGEERQLARLTGQIVSQPYIQQADESAWRTAIPQIDRSHCVLEARSIETNRGQHPISGRLRLTVNGHLLHVAAGDSVEALGWLSIPSRPGNPGQYDFRDHLRRQKCRCILFANHPDAVRKLREGSGLRPARMLGRLRDRAEWLFITQLSLSNVPVASAMLLGNRSALSDESRTVFAESGTMHLLAISGLHVGILSLLLWCGCRLLNYSTLLTAAVVVAGVAAYAAISGGRPPVLRAGVFILIWVTGIVLKRQTSAMNTLALSAVVVLAWNPSDLFDVGAQLSFLAVLGMILAGRWMPAGWRGTGARAGARSAMLDDPHQPGRFSEASRTVGAYLKGCCALMFGIWLLTLPLVAARFHLVSPVGFTINVLMIPLVCLLLWSGFLFLLCGMLFPVAAVPLGAAFDAQLSGLLAVVQHAAELNLGHLYVPGPAAWWIAVYYSLLAAAGSSLFSRTTTRYLLRGLMVWIVAGLVIGLAPTQRNGLRCTVLDMGHGCAVLLEMPGGKTLLYDAGTLTDARRAQQTVQEAIWERGTSRLDAIVISHADVDHFNGAAGLLRTVPVGTVLCSQPFLDFQQQAVRELCDAADERKIPICLIQAGDRLAVDEEVAITVLHPSGGERFERDNENSTVLLIEYAGRRILLTGDLERAGLESLLAGEDQRVDVLLTPHHGSNASNPPELAAWAEPDWVVVGARDSRVLPALRRTFRGGANVVSTGEYGAITFAIDPNGALQVSAFRRPFTLAAETKEAP